MAETVRMYEPMQGRLPPMAHFTEDGGRMVLFFTYQTIERYGVGTDYRSANLYHVMDSDLDTERIMLDLFEEPEKGQARLTFIELNKRAKIHVTNFLRQFEVAVKEHCRYPVWATGSNLYVDLS